MSEGKPLGPPDSSFSAKPLPWTNPGPNEHSKPQEPTTSSTPRAAADPIFNLKNRVITMKQLEALKKRLPPGIDIRINSKNIITFRARFRRTGYPDLMKTFVDVKAAKGWLNEQQRNLDLGIYLPNALASKKTFAEAVARYYKEELPKKGNDARNRKQHLDWWNQHLGASSLALIRPSLIKATISILETEESAKKTKRAPGTVIRYIASLSHLLSVAWKEWEWIPENPVFKIAKPSLSNARQRYLSREEQTALLEEVKKSKCPVLLPIAVLALSTGMRAGKIKNLTWGDVDFAEGVIRLRTTKNGEPLTIPLMGYARSLLSDHQRRGRHLIKEALVFPAPSNPSKPYDIRSAWEAALRRANICDFHFHDLRHTNATTLRKQGKDLYEIGSLLGHKDSRSTARYTHIQTERKSKMVEDLDRELFGEK
ncbi:MAG: site-specific integrase [Chlamydiales bacterium]